MIPLFKGVSFIRKIFMDCVRKVIKYNTIRQYSGSKNADPYFNIALTTGAGMREPFPANNKRRNFLSRKFSLPGEGKVNSLIQECINAGIINDIF